MKKLIILILSLGLLNGLFGRFYIVEQPIAWPISFEDTTFSLGQYKIINVEYDFGKAGIRPESKLLLDTVVLFLQCNPELIVEISSHTDSRGNDAYNKKLSEQRAKSAVDYIISKGIPEDRLTFRGAGESEPVYGEKIIEAVKTEEEKEEMHRTNRRTELKITGLSYIYKTPYQKPSRPEKWMDTDTWLLHFLLGKDHTITNPSLFSSIHLDAKLTQLLEKETSINISKNKRMYFPYSSKECYNNLLVLVSTDNAVEPALFPHSGKCRIFKYNHCSLNWTEVEL